MLSLTIFTFKLIDILNLMGGLAAFLTAAGLIYHSPIGKVIKWLYRKLFGEPITEWAAKSVASIVTPQIASLREENTAQHLANAAALQNHREHLTAQLTHMEKTRKVWRDDALKTLIGVVHAHEQQVHHVPTKENPNEKAIPKAKRFSKPAP